MTMDTDSDPAFRRPTSTIVTVPVAETPGRSKAPTTEAGLRYALPLELEDARDERGYVRTVAILTAAVVVAFAWASLTPIRELTMARGQITPSGQVRALQHYEGGIVAEILAKEGAQVAANTPILRLSPTAAEADLDTLKVRIANLSLRKARTEALLSGRDLASVADSVGASARLAADQRTLFEATIEQKLRERQTLAAQVEQRRSEISALIREIEKADELRKVQAQLLEMREKLAQEGYASRKMLLDAQAAMIQAEAGLNASRGRLDATRDALAQAESRLGQADADARAAWSDELAKISSDLAEAHETLQRYNDRVDRLVVRAPVAGTVLQILPRSPGEVVKPGDAVARIVPRGERLQAEVQVTPDDIAHVRIGDAAELRLSAFDPAVYGKLRGRVTDISAYTLETETKKPYYRARIDFDETDVVGGYTPMTPQPGMIVDAQIITGAKSLMRYLLKPIYRGIDQAFSER